MRVGDIMTMSTPALTANPQTDTAELATMMMDRGLRSVPVVDEDQLVGIITRRDLGARRGRARHVTASVTLEVS